MSSKCECKILVISHKSTTITNSTWLHHHKTACTTISSAKDFLMRSDPPSFSSDDGGGRKIKNFYCSWWFEARCDYAVKTYMSFCHCFFMATTTITRGIKDSSIRKMMELFFKTEAAPGKKISYFLFFKWKNFRVGATAYTCCLE